MKRMLALFLLFFSLNAMAEVVLWSGDTCAVTINFNMEWGTQIMTLRGDMSRAQGTFPSTFSKLEINDFSIGFHCSNDTLRHDVSLYYKILNRKDQVDVENTIHATEFEPVDGCLYSSKERVNLLEGLERGKKYTIIFLFQIFNDEGMYFFGGDNYPGCRISFETYDNPTSVRTSDSDEIQDCYYMNFGSRRIAVGRNSKYLL